jgi:hypothetical protein
MAEVRMNRSHIYERKEMNDGTNNETICIEQALSDDDLRRIHACDHEWVVFSTALQEVCLLVECVECGAFGTIDDPSEEEWCEAYYAPDEPYGWPEKSRVAIRGLSPIRHVAREGSL